MDQKGKFEVREKDVVIHYDITALPDVIDDINEVRPSFDGSDYGLDIEFIGSGVADIEDETGIERECEFFFAIVVGSYVDADGVLHSYDCMDEWEIDVDHVPFFTDRETIEAAAAEVMRDLTRDRQWIVYTGHTEKLEH